MRNVIVQQMALDPKSGRCLPSGEKTAVFHQFGCNYVEFENGIGNFSTAIVEYEDGKISNESIEHVRFI